MMRSKVKLVVAIALVVFVSGCCLKFSDLTSGTKYNVGETIETSGTNIKVEKFQWGNDEWTEGGYAKVDDQGYAKGSGNDMQCNNVNLNFQFDYPLNKITLSFGDLGGNSNIKINGQFKNVSRIKDLQNTTLGNVQITLEAVQDGNNWYGKMTLTGAMTGFSIGGQELWLDNVCPGN